MTEEIRRPIQLMPEDISSATSPDQSNTERFGPSTKNIYNGLKETLSDFKVPDVRINSARICGQAWGTPWELCIGDYAEQQEQPGATIQEAAGQFRDQDQEERNADRDQRRREQNSVIKDKPQKQSAGSTRRGRGSKGLRKK